MKEKKNRIKKDLFNGVICKEGNHQTAGITLIALIITIIILIILAGISINMILGNEGLLNKAKYAKESYSNSQQQEEVEIAKYSNKIDEYTTITNGNREIFEIEELWNGVASKSGDQITLKDSYKNYKELVFIYGNSTQNTRINEKRYYCSTIEWTQKNSGTLRFLWHGTEYLELKCSSETILMVAGGNTAGIFTVYGVK